MKSLINITGIASFLLLVLGLLSFILENVQTTFLLFFGVGLLFLVYIPLNIWYRNHEEKRNKLSGIIEKTDEKVANEKSNQQTKPKGWNMNNSPYRKRKSGLTWGGGNIHAANASRGNRRSFMK